MLGSNLLRKQFSTKLVKSRLEYSKLKPNMAEPLTDKYMEKMIVREKVDKTKNLHPKTKLRWNQMTQAPIPFTYKLHDLEEQQVKSIDNNADGIPSMKRLFKHRNEPLGPLEDLPFEIERTHTGNLPVYTDRRTGGTRNLTVVRKIYGDVDAFKTELSKVVSNAPIVDKMGRLEISG